MPSSTLALNELGGDIHKIVYNDTIDVAVGYAEEKTSSAFKAVYVFLDAFKLAGFIGKDNEVANSLRKHSNLVKLSWGPVDFLTDLNTLRHKTVEWIQNPTKWGFAELLRKVNGLVGPLTDSAELLTKAILYIPVESIHLLSGINGVTLTIGSTWNGVEALRDLYHKWYKPENGEEGKFKVGAEYFCKLVNSIVYVALGILTVLAIFWSFVFSSYVWTPLSVTCVLTSMGSYYFRNIEKEKKIH